MELKHIPGKLGKMQLKRNIILCLVLFFSTGQFAQISESELDKALNGKNYRQQIKIYDSLIKVLGPKDMVLSISFKTRSIELALENNDELLAAQKLTGRARMYKMIGEYDKTEADIAKALPVIFKHHDAKNLQFCYFETGNIKYRKGIINAAMENFLKALTIAETETKDSIAMVSLNNNVGNVLLMQGDFDKAIIYYQKAFAINRSIGDIKSAALTWDNIALVYMNKGDLKTAMKYQQEALEMVKSLNDPDALAELYMNIGAVYNEVNEPDLAIKFFQSGYDLAKKTGNKTEMAGCAINISNVLKGKKKYSEAIKLLHEAYALSKEEGYITNLMASTMNLYETFEAMSDHASALKYFKEYTILKDSVLNLESVNQINELATKHQTSEKEKEIQILTKDKQLDKIKLEKKNSLTTFLFALIAMVVLTLSLILYRYREKNKANKLLEEKNLTISEQKALTEEKNKEITDSINYAKRIQQAILVPPKVIKASFEDVFVIFKPKDIVSGDFYWYAESENNKIIAVADCTGHGVPGGFMSMLGYEILQDVLLKENITTTNEALKTLDVKITATLNKTTENVRDGMEMALCAFSKTNNVLLYSGANRSLIHISNGNLTEHEPNKNTLGGDVDGYEKVYEQHSICYQKDDVFYMFSDGYADQFGGPRSKKFMTKQLKALLLSICKKPMNEQEEILMQTFNSWKGDLEQVDDVCIIGIKV